MLFFCVAWNTLISSRSSRKDNKTFPQLSHLTSWWYNTSPYWASISTRALSWWCESTFEWTLLTMLMTSCITFFRPMCLAHSCSWCKIQWYFKIKPPNSRILSDTSAVRPALLLTMAGAPSVVMPERFSHFFLSITCCTTIKISVPFVVSFSV